MFIAIIASLVSLGRVPRCVLEISDKGQGRLKRIIRLIEKCKVSIHDLSRVGSPARFNMPFELGLAYALKTYKPKLKHLFVVLENRPHALTRVLSDLNAHDPISHRGTVWGAINAILNSLSTPGRGPSPSEVYAMWKKLMQATRQLKRRNHASSVFSRYMFQAIVAAATFIASTK